MMIAAAGREPYLIAQYHLDRLCPPEYRGPLIPGKSGTQSPPQDFELSAGVEWRLSAGQTACGPRLRVVFS